MNYYEFDEWNENKISDCRCTGWSWYKANGTIYSSFTMYGFVYMLTIPIRYSSPNRRPTTNDTNTGRKKKSSEILKGRTTITRTNTWLHTHIQNFDSKCIWFEWWMFIQYMTHYHRIRICYAIFKTRKKGEKYHTWAGYYTWWLSINGEWWTSVWLLNARKKCMYVLCECGCWMVNEVLLNEIVTFESVWKRQNTLHCFCCWKSQTKVNDSLNAVCYVHHHSP